MTNRKLSLGLLMTILVAGAIALMAMPNAYAATISEVSIDSITITPNGATGLSFTCTNPVYDTGIITGYVVDIDDTNHQNIM